MSSHGPFEKGKDIITRTSAGAIHAYQLKKGDIGLSEWRAIYGEIVNLVELAIEIPGLPATVDFVPFLVTNGDFTDPVAEQVRVANVSWASRGLNNQLRTIPKGELFEMFRDAHGAYLPRELVDFRTFLELILHDGTAPADKEKAALLLERILPSDLPSRTDLDIARAAASVALLTAYITGPAELAANHWSTFEYWVLAACYILYLIEKSGRTQTRCDSLFEICELAAENALTALSKECNERQDFVQGLPLDDGHVYRTRMTIIIGLVCSLDLALRIRGKSRNHTSIARSLLQERLKETLFWGESATPYYWMCMLFAEQDCNSNLAEGLAIRLVRDVAEANGESGTGRGAPNPYFSPEQALRLAYRFDELNDEQFGGFSYSIAPLVNFLSRRLRRQALSSLWHSITRISLLDYVPANAAEWYRWKSEEGLLNSCLVEEPQSWEKLRNEANTIATNSLPLSLSHRPGFLLWYVLVYPHRFAPATAKAIDDAVSACSC